MRDAELASSPRRPAPSQAPHLQNNPITSRTTKFDLTLNVTRGPQGLLCSVEYNTDLFEARPSSACWGLADPAGKLLWRMSSSPGPSWHRSTPDKSANCSWTGTPPCAILSMFTPKRLIQEQAERAPDAVALVSDRRA